MPKQHKKLRVVHVSMWVCTSAGGVQTYLTNLTKALKGQPISSLHAAIMPGDLPEYVEEPPHQGKAGLPKWVNALRLMMWLLKRLPNTDLVHIHGATGWPIVMGILACWWCRVPYVISPHGTLNPVFLSQKSLKTRIYLKALGYRLLRGAFAIVATTSVEARDIQAIDGRLRVRVVSPGVPVPDKPVITPHGKASEVLQLVFLGRLEPIKGIPTLFAAMAKLHSKRIDTRLSILGGGTREFCDAMLRCARELRIEHLVVFHGQMSGDAKLDVMKNAHVFVLPSYSENFSFATAEALAIGLPVVVTEGVALADMVRRYRCGSVVPTGDADALAGALVEYRDPGTQGPCTRRAHECALKELSLEAMRQGHAQLYTDAASGGRT